MKQRKLAVHLQRLAKQYPVITMTGPRQSGKTTLCQSTFPDYAYVNLEELDNRQYAVDDPRGFLAQFPDGVILDEVQRTPHLPSYIQALVDQHPQPGQFILTGSQQFEIIDSIHQSLAGRTAILRLLPFALSEIYSNPDEMPALSTLLYTGFYPRIHDSHLSPTEALAFYLATYIERDIKNLINIRNPNLFERFIKLCAANTGQLINYTRLGSDCGIDQKTVENWLAVLEASYIVFRLPPHFKNFRKRLTKSAKLYFYDVGLATYLLGIEQASHIDNHPLKGALFENFIISEFLKNRYNQAKDSNLYFFRDHTGHEVDLILDYGQQLVSTEIKASHTITNDFFKGLAFYHRLAELENEKQLLVYAGDKRWQQQGVAIYPYYHLADLFDDLQ